MKYRLLMLACMSALLSSAQTPETLQTFRLEYKLDFDEQTAPVLGSELGPLVLAGTREVRQQLSLDAPAKRLTIRTFTVTGGAPKVTELRDAQAAELENYRVDVKSIRIAERGFLFDGVVAAEPRVFLAPVIAGDPWSFQVSWWGSTTPTFNQIFIDYANTSVYIPGASGLFEYSSKPNRAPLVVLAPAPDSVFQPEIRLDASATTDPDGDALTYYWRSNRGAVSMAGGDTTTPRVQFHSGPGRYELVLTVTEARGAVAEATVSVGFYGR